MPSGVRLTWSSTMLVISNLLQGVSSLTSMQLPVFSGIRVLNIADINLKSCKTMCFSKKKSYNEQYNTIQLGKIGFRTLL